MSTQPARLVALVGNGVSIAFDQRLVLQRIGEQLAQRIEMSSPSGQVINSTLHTIAERSRTGDPRTDFEVLVGAFGAESTTLDHLERLAMFVAPTENKIREALQVSASFARQIEFTGKSYVLEIITESSEAVYEKKAALNEFVRAIVGSFGDVTIANLNYDALMLSSLSECHSAEFSDQGDGRLPMDLVMPNGGTYRAYVLRKHVNFCNRIHLVQLHGSVTFWDTGDGTLVKLPVDAVRSKALWAAVRDDPTFTPRPLVVLANQQEKAGLVMQEPFALAYRKFVQELANSEQWLVVGYSFRDQCVNDRLAEEFSRKVVPPKVLVVTYGNELAREDVEAAFGWDTTASGYASWLTINRDGANAMAASQDWKVFSGQAQSYPWAS